MTGHDYDEAARMSALAVEAERRRAGRASGYVRPNREDDDHGPEMLTALACICAVVLIVVGAWALWASGVLS